METEVLILLKNLFVFFLIILIGYFIKKKGYVSDKLKSDLSFMMINITMPALVAMSLVQPYDPKMITEGGLVIFISLFAFTISYFIGEFTSKALKIDHEKRNPWIFGSVFPNQGFIGFPIVYSMFGKDGLFLASISNVPATVITFTFGIWIMTRGTKNVSGASWKNFVNMSVVATIIGLILYFARITPPEPVMMTLNTVGNMTPPISMLIVGLMLGEGKLGDMFKDKDVYLISVVRLFLIPISLFFFLSLLPLNLFSKDVAKIMVTLYAMPCAAIASVFANLYDVSPKFTTNMVMLSTVLSMITLPLIFLLF